MKSAGTETSAAVSEVIGEGEGAHRIVRVGDANMKIYVAMTDGEERIEGREQARMLGYSRERDYTRLVKRAESGKPDFGPVLYRATVAPLGNRGGTRIVQEPLLTERQAILMAMLAQTSESWRVKTLVVDGFLALRKFLMDMASAGVTPDEIQQVLHDLAQLKADNASLDARLSLVDPLSNGLAGPWKSRTYILDPIREAAKIHVELMGECDKVERRSRFRREEIQLLNELRMHIRWPACPSGSFENISVLEFPAAVQKALNILQRAQGRQKKFQCALRKMTKQKKLF